MPFTLFKVIHLLFLLTRKTRIMAIIRPYLLQHTSSVVLRKRNGQQSIPIARLSTSVLSICTVIRIRSSEFLLGLAEEAANNSLSGMNIEFGNMT